MMYVFQADDKGPREKRKVRTSLRLACLLSILAVVCGCRGVGRKHQAVLSPHEPPCPIHVAFATLIARRCRESGPDPSDIAASYSRFSSDLQDAASIGQQQHKCREKADANGHVIPTDLEFADEAVSGTKRDRKGLNALFQAAREGRFKILYFESLSRLARESVLTMPMLKELVYVGPSVRHVQRDRVAQSQRDHSAALPLSVPRLKTWSQFADSPC
jgi:Resolvase, N terminal domain